MKKIYVRIICMLLSILLFQEYCKAQVDSMVTFESFDYDNYGNTIYSSVNGWVWNSGSIEREKSEVYTIYPSAYLSSSNSFITNMHSKRILNSPLAVIKERSEDSGSSGYTESSDIFVYDPVFSFLPVAHYQLPKGATQGVSIPDFNTASITIDPKYRKTYQVDAIDTKGRPLQVTDRSGINTSFLYNRFGQTLGTVQNASLNDIAYTSFETSSHNSINVGWVITDKVIDEMYEFRPSGDALGAFSSCEKDGLDPQRTYYLSFWTRSEDGIFDYDINSSGGSITLVDTMRYFNWFTSDWFTHCKYKISGTSVVSLVRNNGKGSGNIYLDELRLYPEDAYMETRTYVLRGGIHLPYHIINSFDKRQTIEYDYAGRMSSIRDQNDNIILSKNYYPWNY